MRKILDGRSTVFGHCASCSTMVRMVWPSSIAGNGSERAPLACERHFRSVMAEYKTRR